MRSMRGVTDHEERFIDFPERVGVGGVADMRGASVTRVCGVERFGVDADGFVHHGGSFRPLHLVHFRLKTALHCDREVKRKREREGGRGDN